MSECVYEIISLNNSMKMLQGIVKKAKIKQNICSAIRTITRIHHAKPKRKKVFSHPKNIKKDLQVYIFTCYIQELTHSQFIEV